MRSTKESFSKTFRLSFFYLLPVFFFFDKVERLGLSSKYGSPVGIESTLGFALGLLERGSVVESGSRGERKRTFWEYIFDGGKGRFRGGDKSNEQERL